MSEFQRSFAKSKLGLFLPAFNELDEEGSKERSPQQQQQIGENLESQDEDSLSECSVTSTITIKPNHQSQNDSASSYSRPLGSVISPTKAIIANLSNLFALGLLRRKNILHLLGLHFLSANCILKLKQSL